MKFGKELDQSLRILLVFSVISTVFKLLQTFSPYIFFQRIHYDFKNYIELNLSWFLVIFIIIAGLCIYIWKKDGKLNLAFMQNNMIRLTSGLLILFEGLFNLSKSISVNFSNIITFYPSTIDFEKKFGTSKEVFLISCVAPSLINLLQLLFGLYFVLYIKNNKVIEHID